MPKTPTPTPRLKLTPAQRRGLLDEVGRLIDHALAVVDGKITTSAAGPGWKAYIYSPTGGGGELLNVQFNLGDRWTEKVG